MATERKYSVYSFLSNNSLKIVLLAGGALLHLAVPPWNSQKLKESIQEDRGPQHRFKALQRAKSQECFEFCSSRFSCYRLPARQDAEVVSRKRIVRVSHHQQDLSGIPISNC